MLFDRSALCVVLLFGLLPGAPALAADGAEAASPLDRLKQRSAAARWEEVRSQWTSVPEQNVGSPSAARPDDDTFIAPPISATPWVDEHSGPAPSPQPPAPALMSSGSGLSRSVLPREPDATTAPSAPEEEDWFFGPEDPLSQQRPGIVSGRRMPASGRMNFDRPVTLPEFLDQDPASDPDRGNTWVAAAYDEGPSPHPGFRQPPDYVSLRPITSIQPFRQYDPKGGDPCEHLCPPLGNCPPGKNYLCPDEYSLPASGSAERLFAHMDYYWLPSNVYHNPLYFQNPALERYGHIHYSDCVEPFFSLGRFGAQVVSLPYQMALYPVCRHEYPLGWYRPGDFAPKKIYQVPFNGRAAATAAAVYTGLFWLVP